MWAKVQMILSVSLLVFLLSLFAFVPKASAIGCFVCSSINGSNPRCEDTFNNTSPTFYEPLCQSGRSNRAGLFPGTSCIKMTAKLDNHTVTVRSCTVDGGGVNSETELGRESHCWMVGEVWFKDRKMKGCTVACHTDGCNTAPTLQRSSLGVTIAIALTMWFTIVHIRW